MNTSLSTGCVESSSSFEMLGASPSCEAFYGTSASDVGESSLPSTDMPDICTSPWGFPGVGALPADAPALAPGIAPPPEVAAVQTTMPSTAS